MIELHPIEYARVYVAGSRIYLPHYTRKGVWVGPCGLTYNEAYLQTYATPSRLMLWPRWGAL